MASANTRRVGDGAEGAFQPYLDSLRQELQQRDPTLVSVAVALLAVLLTLGEEPAVVARAGWRSWGPALQAGEVGGSASLFSTHPPDLSSIERGLRSDLVLGAGVRKAPLCVFSAGRLGPPSLTSTLRCVYL